MAHLGELSGVLNVTWFPSFRRLNVLEREDSPPILHLFGVRMCDVIKVKLKGV